MTTATQTPRPTLGQLNEGTGGKYFSFLNVGDRIEGKVVQCDIVQATAMGTQEPLFWDPEKTRPKWDVVITLETALRDPEDPEDDGVRSCWFKWSGLQQKAIQKAIKDAGGGGDIYPGDYFTAQYTGTVPNKTPGLNPAKQFVMSVRRAPKNGSLTSLGATTPAPAPAAPAAPAAPTPPAAPAAPPAPAPAATAPAAPTPAAPGTQASLEEAMAQFQRIKQAIGMGMTPAAIHALMPNLSLEQIEAVAAAPAS